MVGLKTHFSVRSSAYGPNVATDAADTAARALRCTVRRAHTPRHNVCRDDQLKSVSKGIQK